MRRGRRKRRRKRMRRRRRRKKRRRRSLHIFHSSAMKIALLDSENLDGGN